MQWESSEASLASKPLQGPRDMLRLLRALDAYITRNLSVHARYRVGRN